MSKHSDHPEFKKLLKVSEPLFESMEKHLYQMKDVLDATKVMHDEAKRLMFEEHEPIQCQEALKAARMGVETLHYLTRKDLGERETDDAESEEG